MNKISRRIIKILIFSIFALLLGIIKVNAETANIDGIEWTYTVKDGKAVDVYISSGLLRNPIEVPNELGEYPVTKIGYPEANFSNSNMRKNMVNNANSNSIYEIVLPDSLEEIGDLAFINMQYVNSVHSATHSTNLPNINKIGKYAFCNTRNFQSIDFPSSLTELGDYAFSGSGLSTVTIPATLLNIGDNAFASTSALYQIEFPRVKLNWGKNVFQSSKIQSVTIPKEMEEIPFGMFRSCTSIYDVEIEEGLNKIGDYAFANSTNMSYIILPSSVTEIGAYAFSGNSLYSITSADSSKSPYLEYVTKIGAYAFDNMSRMTTLTIGDKIETIDEGALRTLKNIYIEKEEGTVDIEELNNDFGTIHYLNCKHTTTINALPGIHVYKVNDDNSEEEIIGSIQTPCGGTLKYRVEKDDSYDYGNLCVTLSKLPEVKYTNTYNYILTPYVETLSQYNSASIYTNNNILRDSQIIVQDINAQADLLLRQYINYINYKQIDEDRSPSFEINNGERTYKSSKYPISVEAGDVVRLKIRVYNEGKTNGYVREITEYIPDGLEFMPTSGLNKKYGWTASEDGKKASSSYLKNKNIPAYNKGSRNVISYEEMEIELKVKRNTDDEYKYLAVIGEITDSDDPDSTPGNITLEMLNNYMRDESMASNSNSYIHGEEDDNDYECILVPVSDDIQTDYKLRIEKIDSITGELLNGAVFNLLDEEGNLLKEGVTEIDGTLDFGLMTSVGEGTDIYYIEETQRPEGYNNPYSYKIKVSVTKEIYDKINGLYTLDVACDLVDIDISTSKYEQIPIYTIDQFKKIGSNEDVTIGDETFKFDNKMVYVLQNDLDLSEEAWTPMTASNCMIDGNNHSIKNLTIDTDLTDIKRVGLFATFSGVIENLNLEDVNITISKDESIILPNDATYAVGGFAGYMSEGIIKNSTISGTISATNDENIIQVNNVGGFVGHSEAGKILIFRNCTNNANLTIAGKNVGGLIGCALGAINITGSVNNGAITGKTTYTAENEGGYNIGGFVGCANSSGYEVEFVKASYDKDTRLITLTVANDLYTGKYKAKLENRDLQSLELIEGSVFTIKDSNKQIINDYENVVLENGKLDIADVDITSAGTDVYYIKQISTPEGYEIISNEYIKATVTKRWDFATEKFVVDVNTEIIDEDTFEDDEVEEVESSSKTGIIHRIMNYENVIWTLNKVAIVDSNNNGNVSTESTNSAGFIGRCETSIELNNCTNNAEISSSGTDSRGIKLGGLVGYIVEVNDLSYADIINCTNKGHIYNSSNTWMCDLAGIVSFTEAKTKIKACNNEGKIESDYFNSLAGIVGNSVNDISIYDTKNTGNVLVNADTNGYINLSNASIAGIMSRAIGEPKGLDKNASSKKNIIIDNCENTGNITGAGSSSSILGCAVCNEITITNSKSTNAQITIKAGNVAGILGQIESNRMKMLNCSVKGTEIEGLGSGTYGTVAGIVGNIGDCNGYSSIRTEYCEIKNCTIEDSNINGNKDDAGIVGIVKKINQIEIEDCNVINTDITNNSSDSNNKAAGGVIATVFEVLSCKIKNCNISDGMVESGKETNNGCNIGGIIGQVNRVNVALIDNCTVSNEDIHSNGNSYGSQNNIGGMIGECYCSEEETLLQISNSKLINSNVTSTNFPDVAGIIACANNLKSTKIENCDVIESTISVDGIGNNTVGAIAGSLYGNELDVVNCNVSKSTILFQNTSTQLTNDHVSVGGCIAQNRVKNSRIINCHVKNNSLVKQNCKNYRTLMVTGGVIGYIEGNFTVEDCSFENSTIDSDATNTGGIVACSTSSGNTGNITSFKNNLVKEAEIKTDMADITKSTSLTQLCRGGIVGVCVSRGKFENCQVLDTDIDADSGQLGGIVGVIVGNNELVNCKVSGVELNNRNKLADNGSIYIGGVGAIAGTSCGDNKNITENDINNTEINVSSNENTIIHSGGIFGICPKGITEMAVISNSNINNLTINNNSTGYTGGIIGSTTRSELTISDFNMKNIKLSGASSIGGVAGFAIKLICNNIELEDLTEAKSILDNGSIIAGTEYISGIVGVSSKILNGGNPNIVINKCNINNAKLYSKDAAGMIGYAPVFTMTNSSIKGSEIVGTDNAAGIIATSAYDELLTEPVLTITNEDEEDEEENIIEAPLTVSNTNITAGGHVGGIIANAEKSNVTGVKLDSVTLNATGEEGIAGGIVAVAYNTKYETELDAVEATISKALITNSNITAGNHAGGMIGFATIARIANSEIRNTKITGTRGAVGGYAGVISLNEAEKAAKQAAEEAGTPIVTRDSKLTLVMPTQTDVTLTGNQYIEGDNYIGCGTRE